MAKEKKNKNKQPIKKKSAKSSNELTFDSLEKKASLEENVNELVLFDYVKKELKDIYLEEGGMKNATENHSNSFTFAKPVYLEIHVGNIYSIFGSGIITPAKYLRNRAFSDPQTVSQSALVFANGLLSERSDSVVLLEINIKKQEQNEFIIHNKQAFITKPLPISRIKRVFVSNEKIKREIIATSLSSDGGIIPENLVRPYFPENIPLILFEKSVQPVEGSNYDIQLKQYNKILGTLAFLKNYSFLLSNKLESIASYPDHFFFAAQALNNAKPLQVVNNDKAISFYRQLFMLQNGIESNSLKWLFERVNRGENFNDADVKEFGTILLNNTKSKEFIQLVKEILQGLTKSLERKNVIKRIPFLQDAEKFYLYLFALLRAYGNANSEDKSISRADLPEYISNTYGEFVFGLLGYFYGYNTLRNYDDKIFINNKIFTNSIDIPKRLAIKFELNSLLEYILIESVYNNVFVKKSDSIEVDFIESDSIKRDGIKKTQHLPKEYLFKEQIIFDTYVYQIKKKSAIDELSDAIDKIPLEIPVISEIGVYCFRSGVARHYINLGDLIQDPSKLRFIVYFKREEILEAVKNNKLIAQELLERINISIKFKEF